MERYWRRNRKRFGGKKSQTKLIFPRCIMTIHLPGTRTAQNIYTTTKTTAFLGRNISTKQRSVKKQQMILEVQKFWDSLGKKRIKTVAEHFQISGSTAKKYIHMPASEIAAMDSPKNYKKRESPMNKWLNVIFKMMQDGHDSETIYFYLNYSPNIGN